MIPTIVISVILSVILLGVIRQFFHSEKMKTSFSLAVFGTIFGFFLILYFIELEDGGFFDDDPARVIEYGDSEDSSNVFFGEDSYEGAGFSITIIRPNNIKTRLSDIAGMNEAKKEVWEVVEFLKSPEKYARLGAKPPKGVIMYGPPGTGKTMMARAIAGEAGVPFISTTGSAFDEKYVGTGAARVRQLFEVARKNRPCIVFIDEMDALAGSRERSGESGNDQTVNQFLSEIDNVDSKSSEGIILLGATNRLESIDAAVLRPGRFDRKVFFRLPNLSERADIFRVLLKKIVADEKLDIATLSKITTGYSGADLANLVNEAAIEATRKDKEFVDMTSFEVANDKILLGADLGSGSFSAKERELTAYHEAGHALIGLLHPDHPNIFHKMTIGLRGSSLGATHFRMEAEKYSYTKPEFEASIASSLGGLVAEEVVFGKENVTTGAASDLRAANHVARDMVTDYAMADENTLLVDDVIPQGSEFITRNAEKILDRNYARAKSMIEANRGKLDILAKTLLKKETLGYDDILKLIGPIPEKIKRF